MTNAGLIAHAAEKGLVLAPHHTKAIMVDLIVEHVTKMPLANTPTKRSSNAKRKKKKKRIGDTRQQKQ